jgi:hypothetical protein
MANAAEIRNKGPRFRASHSRDEDHTESTFVTVVSVSVRLHPTNFGAIQHAYGSICYDTATYQPSAVTEGDHMKLVPYTPAIGSLMYAMVATRPDIAHAVGVVSRFMHNPDRPHWNTVKHIFIYLVGTQDYGYQIQTERTLGPSWLY